MLMVRGKDLNSIERETVRISKNPTTVDTANGEVLTKEEATVYVKETIQQLTSQLQEMQEQLISMKDLGEFELRLIWLFDQINLDPKKKKAFDLKNQPADILTKGNFTRDEWNHFLCLFNISHFSSAVLL